MRMPPFKRKKKCPNKNPLGLQKHHNRAVLPASRVFNAVEGVKVPMMTIRTRRVAKSVTKKRWTVLSPESRAQAIAILRDIER